MLTHRTLVEEIEAQRDDIIQFCSTLIRNPSPNPPDDTRAVARVIGERLIANGLPVETVASLIHAPNLISTVEGIAPGPHLVLIGHMDTYPEGDPAKWTRPAFGGIVEDGWLYGAGAGDMKSGLTALIMAYITIAKHREFNGRLTLLAVSEEMNFSPHGARLLVETRPGLVGDAVLDSEPTSPDFVLFGEKGMVWIEVVCRGQSGHGSFAARAPNAIEEMGNVLNELKPLREWRVDLPPVVAGTLAEGGGTRGLDPEALTYCNDDLLPLVSVNFGLIQGGHKINMIADECRAEVDIRLPPGLSTSRVVQFLDEVIARHKWASYRIIQLTEPTWSEPAGPLFGLMLENTDQVCGARPRLEIGIAASDTRLFRLRGTPAAMIGPRVRNEGAADESVAIEDLIRCTKVFALTAHDYLK